MKLTIRRDQADVKGLFGGHKGVRFSLYGRVELTEDERALIERYKVGDYVLASYELKTRGSEAPLAFNLSVADIISGRSVEAGSISTLRQLEEAIKAGCSNLKALLAVMATFGGEEVFEI